MSSPRFFNDDKKPSCSKDLFGTKNKHKADRGKKQREVEKEIFLEARGEDLTTSRERYLAEQKAQHISPLQKKLAGKN